MVLALITATPKTYDWGSPADIPQLLGQRPTGEPQAELWFGGHPGSVTTLENPLAEFCEHDSLQGWLNAQSTRLPFLVKLLAADRPLSLQAHPTLQHARAGFAAENDAKVPMDAPTRNYKDEWHKPELIVALRDGFQALCGFRPPHETADLLESLHQAAGELSRPLIRITDALATSGLRNTVRKILTEPSHDLTEALAFAAASSAPEKWAPEWGLLQQLTSLHPADPGVVIATLMNFVTIRRDEALYLPAGNIHAYVKGFGIEIMAASDNVLRGGLTTKNVDTEELLRILDFAPAAPRTVAPDSADAGTHEYKVPVDDFRLLRIRQRTVDLTIDQHTIALVTDGRAALSAPEGDLSLNQGQASFLTASQCVRITATGTTYIATSRTSSSPWPL